MGLVIPRRSAYAVQAAQDLVKSGVPIFGICLGHQILGQAFGGKTFKLKFGHRGGEPAGEGPGTQARWKSRRRTMALRLIQIHCPLM